MKSEFFTLACTVSKIAISDEELGMLREFLAGSRMRPHVQEAFFRYCKTWKLAPWAYSQLRRFGMINLLEPGVAAMFDHEYEKVKTANENRVDAALQFLRLFRERDMDVAVLKGNLFMYTIYRDTGYKRMNDFDMLIRPGDWVKAQEIYDSLGYIPLGFGWSGEKQEAASFSHAGMSFISPDFHCITGTQWGLKSPTSRYNKEIIGDIWKTTEETDYCGLKLKKLSPEYNLLHLILHMGLYKIGIRDCMDVYNLLAVETIDEDEFLRIASEANAVSKSWFTLMLTHHCSGSVSPTLLSALERNAGGFIRRRLEKRLKMAERTGDMQLSYNDYFHDVEMVVFSFNLYSRFHEKVPYFLRVFAMMFWPKRELALKFCDRTDRPTLWNRLVARLKGPYFTFSLIGEEIGLGVTMLLFVKLFADLLLSVQFYFRRREDYFSYLEKRNVDPEAIRAVVRNIQ